MQADLIHIVPFDIGCSFLDYEYYELISSGEEGI